MKWYTTKEAAKILGYTDYIYINRLIREKRLKARKGKSTKRNFEYRISLKELERFAEENNRKLLIDN